MFEGQRKFESRTETDTSSAERIELILIDFQNRFEAEIGTIETEFAGYEGGHHEYVRVLRERSASIVESIINNSEDFASLAPDEQIDTLQSLVTTCAEQSNNYRFIVSGIVNDFLHPRVVEKRDVEDRFHEDPASTDFASHYPPRELYPS